MVLCAHLKVISYLLNEVLRIAPQKLWWRQTWEFYCLVPEAFLVISLVSHQIQEYFRPTMDFEALTSNLDQQLDVENGSFMMISVRSI